jgi:hypothetical protein
MEEEIRDKGLLQKNMLSEIVSIRQEKAKEILDALHIQLQSIHLSWVEKIDSFLILLIVPSGIPSFKPSKL